MGILEKIFETVKSVAPTVAAMGANAVLPGIGGPLVHRLMRQVTGDPPDTPIADVAQQFADHPELLVQLKTIAANKEIQLAQIAADENTQALATVNATMQAEAGSQGWAAKWRPFWGFVSAIAFGLCVLGLLVLAGLAIYKGKPEYLKVLPDLIFNLSVLFGIPGAILGMASWHRGVMQRTQAGENKPGMIVGAINAIKGK